MIQGNQLRSGGGTVEAALVERTNAKLVAEQQQSGNRVNIGVQLVSMPCNILDSIMQNAEGSGRRSQNDRSGGLAFDSQD